MNYTRPPDVECPYCGAGQEICHDDGEGYTEDELHGQDCRECDKRFGFYTLISFSYESQNVPCFNDVECEFEERSQHKWDDGVITKFYRCKHCGMEKRVDK